MTPLVTIITPTYNKPTYFAQCAESVLAQTFKDWVWWVVFNAWEFPEGYTNILSTHTFGSPERFIHLLWDDPRVHIMWFPVNEAARRQQHVTAHIVNLLYPKVTTPYIFFLPDDDLIDPDGLEALVSEMNPNTRTINTPETNLYYEAVYGSCEVTNEQPDGTFRHFNWLHPGNNPEGSYDIGLGTGIDPDCLIDSSQILHTKALWDRATADGWRLTTEVSEHTAGHADGILLSRLAQFATFHYVPQKIVTHRRTRLSEWHKPILG